MKYEDDLRNFIFLFIKSAYAAACSSNAEMAKCSQDAYRSQDQALNNLYENLMQSSAENVRYDLKKAQRSWIAYRDQTCNAAGDISQFGQEAPLEKLGCLDRMTEVRVLQLNFLAGRKSLIGYHSYLNLNASLKNQDESSTVSQLIGLRPTGKDVIWDANVAAYCKASVDMKRSDEDSCKAFLIFYDFY